MFPYAGIELQMRIDKLHYDSRSEMASIVVEVMDAVKTNIGFVLMSRMESKSQERAEGDMDKLREVAGTLQTLSAQAEEVRRAAMA